MALMLVLRNGSKFNALELAKMAQFSLGRKYARTGSVRSSQIEKPLTLLDARSLSPPFKRNISLTMPKMAAMGDNHTPLWTAERLVSLALVTVFPLAFAVPSQATDAMLAIALVLHVHWGCETMVTDYLRPSLVGNTVNKIAHTALFILSIATLAGLFYLIHNDIGITPTVKKVWAIKGKEGEELSKVAPAAAPPATEKTSWFGDSRKSEQQRAVTPIGEKPAKGWFSSGGDKTK